jgi:hypothetical protein
MSSSTTLETPFDTDVEEGTPPRQNLPPGKYVAIITSASVGPTKSGRGIAVSLTWSIDEGEYEKRLVFQNILIEHESTDAQRLGRYMFQDICKACGVTGKVTDLDVLLYKPCRITVIVRVDKDGQYPDKNEIRNVLPLQETSPPAKNGNAARAVEEASTKQPKAFEPTREDLNDEIPWK